MIFLNAKNINYMIEFYEQGMTYNNFEKINIFLFIYS